MRTFILNIRRSEKPFYRRLRGIAKAILTSRLPLPAFVNPALRIGYGIQHTTEVLLRWSLSYFIDEPLFRGRCERMGKRVRVHRLPWVAGHARIYIGDDVNIFGKVSVFSGRIFEEPRLIIGDRVDIGHNVGFVVNKEIVIEDDVNVASGVRMMDTDSHPRDTADRIADLPPPADEVKPVRICRNAWIGQNTFILKGVTIGEGAVIGVNSVVVTDIPAYTVAMGNPARVVVKNLNAPAAQKPASESARPARTEP